VAEDAADLAMSSLRSMIRWLAKVWRSRGRAGVLIFRVEVGGVGGVPRPRRSRFRAPSGVPVAVAKT